MMEPTFLDLLRDKQCFAKPMQPTPEAAAKAMVRAHVLQQVSDALVRAGERAMVVKGAALAQTVYPHPALRPMHDIDLLVSKERERAVVSALARSGLEICPTPSRPRSETKLGETMMLARAGALSMLVEVHPTLDKIVPRPLDIAALERRASPFPGLAALMIPAAEDHALLVAAHAASHELKHDIGLLDLELLLRVIVDRKVLQTRATEMRLSTVMFLVLSTLRALGAASVDDALVAAFEPHPLRRAALGLVYEIGKYPALRGQTQLGLRWILRQAPLRDDLGRFSAGVVTYAALRVMDYVESRVPQTPQDIG